MTETDCAAVTWLRTPEAIRSRCNGLLALGERDRLPHFAVDLARLHDAARLVAQVTRESYPGLRIPYHARWRHFELDGVDRWQAIADEAGLTDRAERARTEIDLCTVSVLLDAGAGPHWAYRDPTTGRVLRRSEGLAIASLHAFAGGMFSSDPAHPLCADAQGLSCITEQALAAAFQVRSENPLAGLSGRVVLLKNLGTALDRLSGGLEMPLHPLRHSLESGDPSPESQYIGGGGMASRVRGNDEWKPTRLFADSRIGALFDRWRAHPAPLQARDVLRTILDAFAPIWPGRIALAGENLGDVWRHPDAGGDGPAAGLVPFHKLSQWLCYSLIETLERAGVTVAGIDALTGLAEYRNGGLFVDTGVIRLRDPPIARAGLPVGHPAIVEWRALTVALLDRLAPLVRAELGRTDSELPLARILQGGTWTAGRRIARERRADGGPPILMASDGSVF